MVEPFVVLVELQSVEASPEYVMVSLVRSSSHKDLIPLEILLFLHFSAFLLPLFILG